MTYRSSFAEFSRWFEAFEYERLHSGPAKATLEPMLPLLQEPVPCDSCCFSDRCCAERLACERFGRFVAGRPWTDVPATPNRADWAAIFD